MKKIFALTALVFAMTACNHTNPFLTQWDTPYGIPPFDKVKVSDYIPAFNEGIRQHNEEIQTIIDNPEAPTFENVIVALDESGMTLDKVSLVLFAVSESDYSDELNKVVEEVTPILSAHYDNINMNADLFKKVEAVYNSDQSALTTEQKMLLKGYYEGFVNNGIALPQDQQERIKEINSELASVILTFGNNILSESNAFKAKFGFSVANFYDKMASTQDRDLREQIFKGYSNRANNGNEFDNKENILKIMKLRIEKAHILGYDSPAAMILHDKMAGKPETVDAFLAPVMDAAMARAKEEVAGMQALMNEDIEAGLLPEGSTIQPWDYNYYLERLRKARYSFDESEVMEYFKMENVRAGVFGNASRLYGISFEPIEGVALYNPEAEAFKVIDADSSLIGVIITDYYPRDSKRAGAWMTNFVNQFKKADGTDVRPVIVNVGNFNKPSEDQPSLLTIDQVETMFHEFGHALHGLLSQCTYRGLSGTSVKRDFVELPSQINENWAFRPEVLATYAFHYKTGEVIPAELVAKIQNVANFGQGFTLGELCAASILDMKWHELTDIEGVDVEEFEAKVAKEMGLVDEIIPRYRSTYFNHGFGSSGYSAGYYSYLWAEVLDKDAFSIFEQKGIFDRETAMSFRHNVLEAGGSDEPMNLYLKFAGREPDTKAFLKGRGLL